MSRSKANISTVQSMTEMLTTMYSNLPRHRRPSRSSTGNRLSQCHRATCQRANRAEHGAKQKKGPIHALRRDGLSSFGSAMVWIALRLRSRAGRPTDPGRDPKEAIQQARSPLNSDHPRVCGTRYVSPTPETGSERHLVADPTGMLLPALGCIWS